MKKILSLAMAALMLLTSLLLVACDGGESKDPKDTDIFEITKDYVIIKPQQASEAETEAANTLKAAFSEFSGINLVITDDWYSSESDIAELEIIIGNSNRPELEKAQAKAGKLGYTVFASGKKVYIYGSDEEYLDIAIEEFVNTYIAGKTTVSLPNTLDITYNHTFKKTGLQINGVDISEYKIVYGEDGKGATRHNGKWIESGKIKDAALALRDEIYLLTKVKLKVSAATSSNKSDYEIIVGNASKRTEDNEFYSSGTHTFEEYSYGVVGTKLVLAGISSNSSYFAGVAFIRACETMEGTNYTASLVEGKEDLITVACIGDSITDGAGRLDDGSANDHNVHSYPVYLQKLLGFKYYVANYGHGGQRMTSYATESPNYVPSYQAKPDVLIMMFGTNDANKSKYTPDWGTDTARTRYESSASEMIAQYKSVNPDVQIFFMTPPSIISNTTHRQNCALAAQYNREFAQANGLSLVDIWKISEEEQWVFNDGIHPQGEVYKRFAEVIYENIKNTIVK